MLVDRNSFWMLVSLLGNSILSRLSSLTPAFLQQQYYDLKSDIAYLVSDKIEVKQLWQRKQAIIEKALYWLDSSGCLLIIYGSQAYPKLLMHIHSPPVCLFIKGQSNTLSRLQLAIVGSRQCSRYGERCTRYFATLLAQQGVVITSGLALGIDGIAHRAAIHQGCSIAVLGSGLNKIYPKQHEQLASKIVEQGGAVISEFLPDTPPRPYHFPRRNRLISGLSLGVLLIEASQRSGSLITVQHALQQGREVFVLPGPLDSFTMQGNLSLLKQGAYLVTHPADILTVLQQTPLQELLAIPEVGNVPVLSSMILLDTSLQQYQFLFDLLERDKVVDIDWLQQNISCSRELLLQGLLELELAGYIEAVYGGYLKI